MDIKEFILKTVDQLSEVAPAGTEVDPGVETLWKLAEKDIKCAKN